MAISKPDSGALESRIKEAGYPYLGIVFLLFLCAIFMIAAVADGILWAGSGGSSSKASGSAILDALQAAASGDTSSKSNSALRGAVQAFTVISFILCLILFVVAASLYWVGNKWGKWRLPLCIVTNLMVLVAWACWAAIKSPIKSYGMALEIVTWVFLLICIFLLWKNKVPLLNKQVVLEMTEKDVSGPPDANDPEAVYAFSPTTGTGHSAPSSTPNVVQY